MITTQHTHEELFGTFDACLNSKPIIADASSGDNIIRTTEQMLEWANNIDCNCIMATDKQLFVDIDTELHYEMFQHQIKLLKKHFYFKSISIAPSKQGLPHRHITIDMVDSYSVLERVALQACLGSDPTREMLSVRRAINKEENVVVFFEKRTTQTK